MNNDGVQYALRRKDTNEFFWTPKKPAYVKLASDDPRNSNWTKEINKAKLFTKRGVATLAGQTSKNPWEPLKVEILKVGLVIEEIIEVK